MDFNKSMYANFPIWFPSGGEKTAEIIDTEMN